MKVKEVINKIENNEITWDNINDIQIDDPENLYLLKEYAKINSIGEKTKKIRMNSL